MKLLAFYACVEDPVGCYAAGPMLNGATQVLFEGVPTYPDAGRAWDIVDKYKVQSQSHTHLFACLAIHTPGRWGQCKGIHANIWTTITQQPAA